MSRIQIGRATLQGDRRINQDRYISIESEGSILLGLADGMGGHPKGEVAAQILTDTCNSFFYRAPKPIHSPREFLHRLLQKAHENITAYGLDHKPAIKPRTTAVVALIQDGVVRWAHAGDSRLYIFRNGQTLHRTVDHSYVQQLEQHGLIAKEELETHPQRNYVTRCLGGNISSPEITISKSVRLKDGDIVMLCSDGLWTHTRDEVMARVLSGKLPLATSISSLVQEAVNDATPESDNVSAIGLRWNMTGDSSEKQDSIKQQTKEPSEDSVTQAIDDLKSAIEQFETTKTQETK
jgi:PPM family protein phosphatase